MRKVFLVGALCVILLALLLGCTSPVQKPAQEGKNCDLNANCFSSSFTTCEKAYGNYLPDGRTTMYFQVMGIENAKCKVYIQLIDSPDAPDMVKGLDAICKVNVQELIASGGSIDVEKQDCYGPLYDAYKTARTMGLIS